MKNRKMIAMYNGYYKVFGLTPKKYYVIQVKKGLFGGIIVSRDEDRRVDRYKNMRHFSLFWSNISYI